MPLKPEQLEIRRTGVTASEVSSVLGLSPWGTPQEVWADKRGYGPPKQQTEAMRRGDEYELPILNMMAHRHSLTIIKTGEEQQTVRSGANPLVIATPDGIVIDQHRRPVAVAEAKAPGRGTAKHWIHPKDDPNGIPVYYMPQVQWQLGALGLPYAWVGADVWGELYTYQIPYREDIFLPMLAHIEQWWYDYVVKDRCPPPTDKEATWAWVNSFYKQETEQVTYLEGAGADDLERWIDRYNQAKIAEKENHAKAKKAESKIKAAIGNDLGLETDKWECTWKEGKGKKVVDMKALEKEIDLDKYRIEKPGTRYFRVKQKDTDKEGKES